MTKRPKTQPTDALTAAIQADLDTIESALKNARTFASSHRYGGTGNLHTELIRAIEALERIAKIAKTRQPQLF